MASVKVILYEHKTLSDDSHPILISIIQDKKRKTMSLGYSATKNQWNYDKNLPSKKHPNFSLLSMKIKRVKADIQGIILDLDNKGRHYTAEDVLKAYNNNSTDMTFKEYCEKLIKDMEQSGKRGNAIVYNSALSSFLDFAQKKSYNISDIDYETVKKYQNFLERKVREFKKMNITKKLTANGISFYMRTLRAIINKAMKDGLMDERQYPFKNITIKSEKTRKRAVDKSVIKALEDLDASENNLQLYKDLFLFSFYNRGMNFVDISFLKAGNIQNGRITYTRQKTRQQFSIKITDKAREILSRYNDLSDADSYIFPIINRKGNEYQDYRNAMRLMNKKLKVISEILNLEAPLTTYVSRHSWATIAKRSGVATSVISEGLGHTTEEVTQIYLDSFENDILDAANDIITG